MGCLDEQTVLAFVSGALRGPALGAVERHLIGCPSCAGLVALAAPPGARSPWPAGPTPDLETTVGRYRLLRLVGRGGMGEVYAAHDPELDRRVAIKILRADARPDDIEAARLLREAQAVAKLSHPNVVAIYDVGTAAGRMFLTMELVEGETLAVWQSRLRRSREEILRMFVAAGRGLAAAHRAGIVHRDFKPQNVMVARDGTPRVMDFGLAAHGGPTARNEPRLTRTGSILGTPLYMSPEQMLGQPADPRADQFSFCVALWEALHGARPFDGASVLEIRAAVLSGQPRKGPLGSRVPRRIHAALARGLSVKRDQRFPSMEALLDVLATPAAGRARRRTTMAAGALVALVGAAVLAGFAIPRLRVGALRSACDPTAKLGAAWDPSPGARRRRELAAAFATTDVPDARARAERTSQALDAYASKWAAGARQACESAAGAAAAGDAKTACFDRERAELGALTEVLQRADARVVRRSLAAVLSLQPPDACNDRSAYEPAPPDPAIRARVADLTTRLLSLRAAAAAGQDWQALEPIAALTEDVRGTGYAPLLTETLLVNGRIRSPFDPDAAIPLYEEAYKHASQLHDDAGAAEAAIQLAAIAGTVEHRYPDADRWAGLAETALDRSGGHGALRGWFLNVRGALEAARGTWQRAETDFAASATLREQALGPEHPELAASLGNLARAAEALGETARALDAAGRAFKIAAAIYPPDSYESSAPRLVRGAALLDLKRLPEARDDAQAALAGYERTLGRDHPFLADPMTVLGQLALAEGRPLDARALLERAWEIRSTHVADAGAREETAFALARAIWSASETDRPHALELAREAQEGYAAIPDLAPRLATVEAWIGERQTRRPPRQDAR